MRYALPVLILPLLSACADYGVDYPALSPTDQLLAEPGPSAAAIPPQQVNTTVETRAGALKSRAGALRQAGASQQPSRAAALHERAAELRDLPDNQAQ